MKKSSVIVTAVFGAAFLLVNTVLREYIIIHAHYSTWKSYSTVSLALFAVSAAFTVFKAVSKAKKAKDAKIETAKQELEEESKKREKKREINTPEGVYKYICYELMSDKEITPECHRLLSQLDDMNKAQAKLDNLLDMNDMTGLEQSKIVLQRIEDDMCSECRTLINKYIVGGAAPFKQNVEKSYNLNAKRLEKVQALLNTMAEYANGKISGSDATAFLESYMSVIQDEMSDSSRYQTLQIQNEKDRWNRI